MSQLLLFLIGGGKVEPFFHGIILAFGLILPLGVQNIFVFNQGAAHKKLSKALPVILTASICDTLLIGMAVSGVSIIVFSFEWLRNMLFIIGMIFLIYMGWGMWRTKTQGDQQPSRAFSTKQQITFAASVSLLNPHAIMDTIGVIGTSSLVYSGLGKWVFALACIGVSWIWFFSLAFAGGKIGLVDRNGHLLNRINQISAIIIWGMAIYMGYQFYIYSS